MFDYSVNVSKSLLSRFEHRLSEAQHFLDSEVIRQSRPFVPFLQGTLANTAIIEQPGRVVYPQPYARRMFYGDDFDFTTTFHPLAGARWTDRAAVALYNDWMKGVERILKGGNR